MSAPEPDESGPGRVKLGALRSLCLGTLASFALLAVWAVAMPLYSGPDEPSQVVHAAALVRGQLIGTPGPGYGLLVVLLWRLTGPLERRAQPAHARRPSGQPSTIRPPR